MQLSSKETPKRLPDAQIRQINIHIYQKNINNPTTTKEPAKAKKHNKPEVWKWIPKQQHQEISTPKYRWIPKLPTTSPQQSPPELIKKPRES